MTTGTEQAQSKPVDSMEIIGLLLGELRDMRAELKSIKENGGGMTTAVKTGKGRQMAKPVRDLITGKVYHTESGAGMAVAPDYKLPTEVFSKKQGKVVRNSFVWYSIPQAEREARFQHISEEEYQAIVKTTPAPATPPVAVVTATPPASTHQPQKPVQPNQAKAK